VLRIFAGFGEIRVLPFDPWVLISMSQLPIHARISTMILLILLDSALALILILVSFHNVLLSDLPPSHESALSTVPKRRSKSSPEELI